jgi:hypothetical protein
MIHAVSSAITTQQTQPKADNKASTPSIAFGSIFDAVKKSMEGVMTVAANINSNEIDLRKEKHEVEKKREFKTDLEEAYEILEKITKMMEKKGQA